MTSLSTSLIIHGDLTKVADFYGTVFAPNVTILSAPTSVSTNNLQSAILQIYSHNFTIFNLGPDEKPSPATSFMINCDNGQDEVDTLWSGLCQGGEELRCGWVKDQFGFFWQIVPKELGNLMKTTDPELRNRVMQAMMKMKKIDIAGLKKAAAATDVAE